MAEISYLDFDLLIVRLGEAKYRARVLSSPAGQAVTELTLPFSDLELENFLLKVGRTRRGVRRLESPEMEAAKVFGGKLFKSIFDGELMSCFRSSLDEAKKQNQGLRIRLRLNDAPELVNLPWEYLYNPSLNRFLSLSVSTPLVRYLELPERITPLAVTLPIRALAVISSPSDYPKLDVEREWNNLKSALSSLEQKGLLVLDRLETASPVALQYSIRRTEYHVFHFIGHGGFNEQAQDGILMFEDENQRGRPLSGQYLGTLLHDEQTLRLAVLNACEGARSGNTDPFAGVAQSLVQQGLPAVIAMQFEVTDEAAITFAREFYTAIAEGYPVDAAMSEARKAIFSLGNDIEWGTPVLYMRAPDGQVFDISKAPVVEKDALVHREAEPKRGALLPQEEAKRVEQLYTDGLSAYWLKDWGRAWEYFRQVVEIDPSYEDAADRLESVKRQLTLATLSNDADRYIQEGDWLDAQDVLKRLVAQDPAYQNASARLELVNKNLQLADLYDQARHLHKSQHWEAVLNVFAQIHALQPDYPDPDGLLDSARRELAQSEQQARLQELYRQALNAMDGSRWMEAQGLLTQIQQIQPDYNETPRLLERVRTEIKAETSQRQRQELVTAAYQQAGEMLRSRQWRRALAAMDEVGKLDPHFVDTQGIAAAAREGLAGEQAEARQKEALAAQYAETVRLLDAGEAARALEAWEKLNAQSPGYADPQNVSVRASKMLEDLTTAPIAPPVVKPRPSPRRLLTLGGALGGGLLCIVIAVAFLSNVWSHMKANAEATARASVIGMVTEAPTAAPARQITESPAATEMPAATEAPARTEAPAVVTVERKVVSFLWTQEFDNLNPLYTQMWYVSTLYPVYLCQAWWFDDNNMAVPNLVTEIPSLQNGGISSDGRTITLNLRGDMVWSDGEPITSRDLKFTYDMVMSDRNAVVASRTPYDLIQSFEIVDDYTVKITFQQPYAPWQSNLFSGSPGVSILPEHILRPIYDAQGTLDNAEWNRAPTVGCGPFVFEDWVPGEYARFVANDNFWLGRPKLDELFFRFVPDNAAMSAAMLAGDGDVGTFFAYSDLPQLEAAGIKVMNAYSGFNEGWYFNLHPEKGHPALKDWRVRQAIAFALDREKLVQDLLFGQTRVAASPWDNTPWVDPSIVPTAYDPDKARELLAEAGWVDSDGDGYVDNSGVALVLKYGTTNRQIRQNVQAMAQQDLAQIGIKLDLQSFEPATFFAGYSDDGPSSNFSLDIIEYSNSPHFPDPNSDDFRCWAIPTIDNPYGANSGGICDDTLESLFAQQESQVDFAQRQQTFYQISRYIFDNNYWLGLWQDPELFGFSPRMLNVKMSGFTPFFNVAEWDVAE